MQGMDVSEKKNVRRVESSLSAFSLSSVIVPKGYLYSLYSPTFSVTNSTLHKVWFGHGV